MSLPRAQLSCRELLVVIKAAEPVQNFDWATVDIAGTFNLLVSEEIKDFELNLAGDGIFCADILYLTNESRANMY